MNFHFIDDWRCISSLKDSHINGEPELSSQEVDQKRELLSQLFLEAGWEGDGNINCIFLAPCFAGRDDGHCEIIYHVKQDNNGTSWLAIPRGLCSGLPTGFLSEH